MREVRGGTSSPRPLLPAALPAVLSSWAARAPRRSFCRDMLSQAGRRLLVARAPACRCLAPADCGGAWVQVSAWLDEAVLPQHGRALALSVVAPTLLHIGDKTLTHMVTMLERYQPLLARLAPDRPAQADLVAIAARFWASSPQVRPAGPPLGLSRPQPPLVEADAPDRLLLFPCLLPPSSCHCCPFSALLRAPAPG
jgi:hypothetical protein